MKILEKLKKVFWGVGVFWTTLHMNVYGYGLTPLYGIEKPKPEPKESILENIGKIISIIIIPLILIIGIIIYLKKSQSSKLRKFITVLLAVMIAILLCFGINKIIELLL